MFADCLATGGGDARAEFVPSDFAAVRVVAAHDLAALGVSTERRETLEAATSGSGGSATKAHAIVNRDGPLRLHVWKCQITTRDQNALVAGETYAVRVPCDRTAGRIKFADQLRTECVIAADAWMGQEAIAQSGVPWNGSADQSGGYLSAASVPLIPVELIDALRIVIFNGREGVCDIGKECEIASRLAVVRIDVAEQYAKRLKGGRHRIGLGSRGFRNRGKEEVSREDGDAWVLRRCEEGHRREGAGDVPVSGAAARGVQKADFFLHDDVGAG